MNVNAANTATQTSKSTTELDIATDSRHHQRTRTSHSLAAMIEKPISDCQVRGLPTDESASIYRCLFNQPSPLSCQRERGEDFCTVVLSSATLYINSSDRRATSAAAAQTKRASASLGIFICISCQTLLFQNKDNCEIKLAEVHDCSRTKHIGS